jgi:hypothetical protein
MAAINPDDYQRTISTLHIHSPKERFLPALQRDARLQSFNPGNRDNKRIALKERKAGR